MPSRFDDLFATELSFLRTLGKEYGAANPALMRVFGDGVPDPDVERLLEGFAFLSARIRERVEREVPAFSRTMIDTIFPGRPSTLPAATMMRFSPRQAGLGAVHRVPKGTEVASQPIEGVPCIFRTARELDCLPVEVQSLQRHAFPSGERLVLGFTAPEGVHPLAEGRLRLFVNAPITAASNTVMCLTKHLSKVRYSDENGEIDSPASCLTGVFDDTGFATTTAQWAPPGYAPLSRLLVHPTELLTFDIDLRAALVGRTATSFQLEFVVENAPIPLPDLLPNQFVPNCTEVHNSFVTTADPVSIDGVGGAGTERVLRTSGGSRASFEILAVDRVVGIEKKRGRRVDLDRWPTAPGVTPSPLGYALRWFPSPVDGATEVALRLVGPDVSADARVLSLDVTCSNRDLANQLGVGDVCMPTPRSPSFLKFENVTPLSRPSRLGLDAENWHEATTQLGMFRAPLTDAASFQHVLGLLAPSPSSDLVRARTNETWRKGIQEVGSAPVASRRKVSRRLLGDWVRGARCTIALDDKRFGGPGEAFLLGAAIHHLVAERREVNSVRETEVHLRGSGARWTWVSKEKRGGVHV